MKVTVSLLLTAMFVSVGFCQKSFLPGKIVKQDGDTVSGFVDYRNWERNPKKIVFRESESGPSTEYLALAVMSFIVEDEVYRAAIVDTEISSSPTVEAYIKEPVLKRDTAFLQTVISGPKSLFYYKTDMGQENFYILNESDEFELLIYKKYMRKREGLSIGGDMQAENKRFLGQLNLYLQDCPDIATKLERVVYQKRSLESVFDFYYKKTGATSEFQKKTEKTDLRFGIAAGATLTNVDFKPSGRPYLVENEFSDSIDPTFGLYFEIIFPRNRQRWSLSNELLFASYHMDGDHERTISIFEHEANTFEFGATNIRLATSIRYNFRVKNIKPFIALGVAHGLAIKQENSRHVVNTYNTIVNEYDREALINYRTFEQNTVLGLGLRSDRFFVELAKETNIQGLTSSASGYLTRYSFVVGYGLWRRTDSQ